MFDQQSNIWVCWLGSLRSFKDQLEVVSQLTGPQEPENRWICRDMCAFGGHPLGWLERKHEEHDMFLAAKTACSTYPCVPWSRLLAAYGHGSHLRGSPAVVQISKGSMTHPSAPCVNTDRCSCQGFSVLPATTVVGKLNNNRYFTH